MVYERYFHLEYQVKEGEPFIRCTTNEELAGPFYHEPSKEEVVQRIFPSNPEIPLEKFQVVDALKIPRQRKPRKVRDSWDDVPWPEGIHQGVPDWPAMRANTLP